MGTCLQRCIEPIFQERKRIATTTTATIKKELTLVEADTTIFKLVVGWVYLRFFV